MLSGSVFDVRFIYRFLGIIAFVRGDHAGPVCGYPLGNPHGARVGYLAGTRAGLPCGYPPGNPRGSQPLSSGTGSSSASLAYVVTVDSTLALAQLLQPSLAFLF